MNTTPIEFMAWDETNNTITHLKELSIRKVYDNSNDLIYKIDYNVYISPNLLLQRTSLHSINDEPIYNHQIVMCEEGYHYVVDMFNYRLMYLLDTCELEIVGNRFQNPELLELCK